MLGASLGAVLGASLGARFVPLLFLSSPSFPTLLHSLTSKPLFRFALSISRLPSLGTRPQVPSNYVEDIEADSDDDEQLDIYEPAGVVSWEIIWRCHQRDPNLVLR